MAKWEADSLVGQTLGQFEIKSELGRGGMAVVYKGYQPSLDRWVAIKTLPRESAANRDLVSRFHREAEAMVSLNHTNIVQIIDKGEDKAYYYFAMEFVEGPSLRDLLKQEQLSVELLFDIALQICEGLAYAHKKGIVHRDIKPANVFWEQGTSLAKIGDFGIARLTAKPEEMITLTATNVGMGTMNYMAPEQKTDAGSVDHRADIYSTGVMLYEMFTGKLPMGRFKLPSQLNPTLPRKLDEVISRCLEADPADRYEGMEALKADLQAARAAAGSGTLMRSVRDAAERTLTAVKGGGGGGGGVRVAACLLVTLGLVGGGGAAAKVLWWDKRTTGGDVAGTGGQTPRDPNGQGDTPDGDPGTSTSGNGADDSGTTSTSGETTSGTGGESSGTGGETSGTSGETTSGTDGETTSGTGGETASSTGGETSGTGGETTSGTGGETTSGTGGETTSGTGGETARTGGETTTGTGGETSASAASATDTAANGNDGGAATNGSGSDGSAAGAPNDPQDARTSGGEAQPVVTRLTDVEREALAEARLALQRDLARWRDAANEWSVWARLEPRWSEAQAALEAAADPEPGSAVALERARTRLLEEVDALLRARGEQAVADAVGARGRLRQAGQQARSELRAATQIRELTPRLDALEAVLRKLRGVEAETTRKEAEAALAMARLRVGDAALAGDAITRFDAALGHLREGAFLQAIDGLKAARDAWLAQRAPVPTGTLELAIEPNTTLVSDITRRKEADTFSSIAAGPGGMFVAIEHSARSSSSLYLIERAGAALRIVSKHPVLSNGFHVAEAGVDRDGNHSYWVGTLTSQGSQIQRYSFDSRGAPVPRAMRPLDLNDWIFDMATGPDGRLHVVLQDAVLTFFDGVEEERQRLSSAFTAERVPRRVAALPSGLLVSGVKEGGDWRNETSGWTCLLQPLQRGQPSEAVAISANPLAITALGDRILAVDHQGDRNVYLLDPAIASGEHRAVLGDEAQGIKRPLTALDVVASGSSVYVLDRRPQKGFTTRARVLVLEWR